MGFAAGEASRLPLCVNLGTLFVFLCSSLDDRVRFCRCQYLLNDVRDMEWCREWYGGGVQDLWEYAMCVPPCHALVSPCDGLDDGYHSGGCIAHPLKLWYCDLVTNVIHPLFCVFIHPLFWIRGRSTIENGIKVSGKHFEDTNCPAVPSNGDHISLEFSGQFSDVQLR